MIFITDIFDKTFKMVNTLEFDYLNLPVAQRTTDILNRNISSAEYFFCDLYADTGWLKTNHGFNDLFFDLFIEDEAIATAGYLSFNIINSDRYNAEVNYKYHSSVAVIIATDTIFKDERLLAQLKFNSGNYLYYIFINVNVEHIEDLKKLKYNFTGNAVEMRASDVTKSSFLNYVETNLVSKENMRDAQTLSLLKQIKPFLQDLYRTSINDKKELDKLIGEKDAIRENINRINGDNTCNESVGKSRAELQVTVREMERSIKKKYTDLLLPNNGSFSNTVDKLVDKLDKFETKVSSDKRFPKLLTSVADNYIKAYGGVIKLKLKEKFSEDEQEITAKMEHLSLNIPVSIAGNNKNTFKKPVVKHIAFPDKDKIIDGYSNINKTYSGEIPKSNFQTYLMQIRQQTFFIFILMALLSPLFQVPKLFIKHVDNSKFEHFQEKIYQADEEIATKESNGEDASDLRTIKSVYTDSLRSLKDLQTTSSRQIEKTDTVLNYISVIVGLLTVLFAIYFVIDLKKNIPKIKEELNKKELDRIQRELRQDGNRIFADAVRDWLNKINSWFVEVAEHLTSQMDDVLNSGSLARKGTLEQLEARHNAIVKKINEGTTLYNNTERILLPLITEYNNNLTNLENKFLNMAALFRNRRNTNA